MKTSCIRHPSQKQFLVIHQWQLDFCEGDHTTAALLSFFEGWHNTNLAAFEQHQNFINYCEKMGQKITVPAPNLYIPRTEQQLIDGVLQSCKSPAKLRKSLKFLSEKGAISIHKNPRDCYDRMNFYLFHPEVLNCWINETYPPEPAPETPVAKRLAERQGAMNNHTPYQPATKVTKTKDTDLTKVTKTNDTEKTCPKCGSSMTQRKNKAGQTFWGCTQYPKCDHTESITLTTRSPPSSLPSSPPPLPLLPRRKPKIQEDMTDEQIEERRRLLLQQCREKTSRSQPSVHRSSG